jgi:PAS domain S-box-containing protein
MLALHEPLLVLDAALRVVMANPAFLVEFGLSDDEAKGHSVYRLNQEAWNTAEVRELLERAIPSSELIEDHPLALRGLGPLGSGYRVNARPLRSGANELRYLLLAFRRVEPATSAPPADDEESLRSLAAEHGADVVVLYREDGRCAFLSSPAERVLGYEVKEWMNRTACDLIHPDDCADFLARLAPEENGQGIMQAVARVRRAGGEYAWVEAIAQRVVHPTEGKLMHATLRDVTQRKRAEDALRWLSRQTKLILDSAAEGIFGVDTVGTVTFANPAAARILGLIAEDLIGNSYRMFVGQPSVEGGTPEDEIAATLRDGLTRTVRRAVFLGHQEQPVAVEFTCNAARQHGAVVGAVITFRDISERIQAEATIRRSEWLAAVGQTVQAFRHEINNPLSALLAGVQLLEMGGNTPEEEAEMIASVADHARRIRDAVRQLTLAPPAPE